jgi:hypothetical protein
MIVRGIGNLAERDPAVAPKEIERGVGCDAGQPVRGFLLVFQLVLPLKGFDESLLREVLRVVHVADNAIDLKEDATEMLRNETFFEFEGRCSDRSLGTREILVHQTRWRDRVHPLQK